MSKGQRIQGLAAVVALAAATAPPPDIVEGGEAASELPPLPNAPPERFERAPLGTFAETVLGHRRRAVFDASVPLVVDGARVVFAPGDPVPDHIDPATLPHGAVRHLIEEG